MESLPAEWQEAYRRDAETKPALSDPLPERRQARLLAAFILSGVVFMLAPGTLLGVWNLVGISSRHGLEAISPAWIQAHGHAQFFGWVATFLIGISLHTLPKFRRAALRSIPAGWAMWALWTAGAGLRWWAGIQSVAHPALFRLSAGLELGVAMLLVWQCSGPAPKGRPRDVWEIPIFAGFAGLVLVLAWQFRLVMQPLAAPALPLAENRKLISLALWCFAFPVVFGYCLKFFPGLTGTRPANKAGTFAATGLLLAAGAGWVADSVVAAACATFCAVVLAAWSLGVFHPRAGNPKTSGVYPRYPLFARLAWGWLAVAAVLGFAASRPGVLGASRHAFTVGFLATLIFSIGPRVLPSFLNSRELWSIPLMRWSLVLITAGCTVRVVSEPLAYGELAPFAWKLLPFSAFAELAAVVLFAVNLAMSLATPVPSWFGRKHVNAQMSVYWLVASYPATRRLLVENGLATLARARIVPKSLSLAEAARADGARPDILVEKLGDFFEARLAPSLRKKEG